MSHAETIWDETMRPSGFLERAVAGTIDEAAFSRLVASLSAWADGREDDPERPLDRKVVAAMYEVAWELENASRRLAGSPAGVAKRLSSMADHVRGTMQRGLWAGLDAGS